MQPTPPKKELFFLLIKEDGTAETVELGGERCLCVFTDDVLITPFYTGRYGPHYGNRDVPTRWFDGVEALREFLRGNETLLAGQNVRHMAMNPAPRKNVDRVPIKAFIDAGDAK
jgi:hypothetical protein